MCGCRPVQSELAGECVCRLANANTLVCQHESTTHTSGHRMHLTVVVISTREELVRHR